jgi:hypothetical protein
MEASCRHRIGIQILFYYGQNRPILTVIANMPRKPPIVFPQEQRLLTELGERLRLARRRRKLSNAVVSQRADISRSTLYKVEAGNPGATMGSYIRVLQCSASRTTSTGLPLTTRLGANSRTWAWNRRRSQCVDHAPLANDQEPARLHWHPIRKGRCERLNGEMARTRSLNSRACGL